MSSNSTTNAILKTGNRPHMASNHITSPPDLLNSLNIKEDPVSNQFYFQESSFYQEELEKVNMSYIPNSVANLQYTPQVTVSQQHPQVPPPSYQQQHISLQQPPPPPQTHVTMLKRKMTLDLNNAKRARNTLFSAGHTPGTADVLSSPDMQKLNLPTPELDRLIMSTANPNVLQTPTSVFFPKNVTEEQELYAKGFEHALKQLHDQSNTTSSSFSQDHDDNSSTSSSYNSANKQTFHDFSNVIVKEEPQTVPDDDDDNDDSQDSSSGGDDTSGGELSSVGRGSGSKINPIDMVSQEKIKLERKRQRNRLAASKCRRKKLEKISKLEDKVKQLKGENNELGNVLVKLRESVQLLKSQVMEHVQAGCAIVVNMGGGGGSGGNFS